MVGVPLEDSATQPPDSDDLARNQRPIYAVHSFAP